MYVELLHRIVLNFLDFYVAVDAIPRDGKKDHYCQCAAHGDWRRLVSESEPSTWGALIFWNRKQINVPGAVTISD
jgi:hypothetical protein